jgi:hypothetical protein
LPPGFSSADSFYSINNAGQVTGVATASDGALVPFIATGSSSVAVPFPTGLTPQQVFINNLGQIAGYAGSSTSPSIVPYYRHC